MRPSALKGGRIPGVLRSGLDYYKTAGALFALNFSHYGRSENIDGF